MDALLRRDCSFVLLKDPRGSNVLLKKEEINFTSCSSVLLPSGQTGVVVYFISFQGL